MHELKNWFAGLKIHLHAEHGAVDETEKRRISPGEEAILGELGSGMEAIAHKFSGTRVETKKFSLCFHYRNATPYDGEAARLEVKQYASSHFPSLQILEGKKTVEARFPHLHKGVVVRELMEECSPCLIVAIGDDQTDEDMFNAVPSIGYSIVVGGQPSHAKFRLRDSDDVRQLLKELNVRLEFEKNAVPSREPLDLPPPVSPRFYLDRSVDFASV